MFIVLPFLRAVAAQPFPLKYVFPEAGLADRQSIEQIER
jgi:hypothetical protein